MIIKCITKNLDMSGLGYSFITPGKLYEVLNYKSETDKYYNIINDRGDKDRFLKTCFVSLDEIRNDKLNQLGI